MEFGLYQKENGFAENAKRLKTNLLKWFVVKNFKKLLEREKLIAFISEMRTVPI